LILKPINSVCAKIISGGIHMKQLKFEKLYIKTTHDDRTLRVLLPDDYETSKKSYKVLYMHDGQNLFEDHIAYGGHSWGIYEVIKELQKTDKIEEMIVVGIDNSHLRFFEYSPWKNTAFIDRFGGQSVGGMGDIYAEFIVDRVIPLIESNYRVKQNKEDRMIAGSSMGGYISAYIGARYPNLFGVIGVFSLASWFNEDDFLNFINNSLITEDQKFFISIGRNETSSNEISNFNEIYLNNSRNLKNLLQNKGIKHIYYIETDDVHNELAWKKVFPHFIRFINKKPT
jgi:predicted alpha/beta superfamily hydrolase